MPVPTTAVTARRSCRGAGGFVSSRLRRRSSSVVEQGTHKPLVGGSNPPSATNPPSRNSIGCASLRGAACPRACPTAPRWSWPSPVGPIRWRCSRARRALGRWRLGTGALAVAHRDHDCARRRPRSDAAAAAGSRSAWRRTCTGPMSPPSPAPRAGRSRMPAAQARYRFLEERGHGSGRRRSIATGAHRRRRGGDMLLAWLRGSGLRGLRGIPARRGRSCGRCSMRGARRCAPRSTRPGSRYLLDPTNDDASPRPATGCGHDVLPALERLNPRAVEALTRLRRAWRRTTTTLLDAIAAAELARRRGPTRSIDWREPPARALGRRVAAPGDRGAGAVGGAHRGAARRGRGRARRPDHRARRRPQRIGPGAAYHAASGSGLTRGVPWRVSIHAVETDWHRSCHGMGESGRLVRMPWRTYTSPTCVRAGRRLTGLRPGVDPYGGIERHNS